MQLSFQDNFRRSRYDRKLDILLFLKENGTANITKIMSAVNIAAPQVREDVDSLKRAGLLERIEPSRKVNLYPDNTLRITEKGLPLANLWQDIKQRF